MTSAPVSRSLIQIAGVLDLAEGRMLQSHGVDWLGWPLRLPVNEEDVTEAEAAQLVSALPPTDQHVLITYESTAAAADAFCRQLGVRRIQLHGPIPAAELRALRERRPDLCIIKSLVVGQGSEEALQALLDETSAFVDAFITDTYDPTTGAEGATGQTHDWDVSRRLVAHSPRPVILAGGLTPDNVGAAIRHVRPAGVDVHTGVEAMDGRKDPALVARFVAEAKAAFSTIS